MKLNDIDGVLFDLDGTVYKGEVLMPGANETINFFRNAGKHVRFASNNSGNSRKQIFGKFERLGVSGSEDEILSSGYLAAAYAKKAGLKSVYVFGTDALRSEFSAVGIEPDLSEDAENIVIGYNRNMRFADLEEAYQVARKAKCVIACNRDSVHPVAVGRLIPGCGAMVAAFEYSLGKPVDVVVGKPSSTMLDVFCEETGIKPGRVLVVGDLLESDIAMADNAGSPSVYLTENPVAGRTCCPTIKEVTALFE